MKSIFMLGTDTSAGKTHASAALMLRYPDLFYWKAVQTGFPPDDDSALVQELTGIAGERFIQTGFSYREPLSPHIASELEGKYLDVESILRKYREISENRPVLVEGAGGLLVPINRKETWADFLIRCNLQIVIAARTGLGTINHTLMTVRCLEANRLKPAGIIFCGKNNEDNIRTIHEFSGIPVLGQFYHESGMDLNSLDPAAIDPDGVLSANPSRNL